MGFHSNRKTSYIEFVLVSANHSRGLLWGHQSRWMSFQIWVSTILAGPCAAHLRFCCAYVKTVCLCSCQEEGTTCQADGGYLRGENYIPFSTIYFFYLRTRGFNVVYLFLLFAVFQRPIRHKWWSQLSSPPSVYILLDLLPLRAIWEQIVFLLFPWVLLRCA